MSIPDWSDLSTIGDYVKVNEIQPNDSQASVESISIGPEDLGNSKGKLNSRYWIVYSVYGSVFVKGSVNGLWGEAIALFPEPLTINEISLTFDQLGRPLVFYRVGEDTLKLFWYNPVISAAETVVIAQGHSPKAGFDFPLDVGVSYSDSLLFYVRNDEVRGDIIYMRVQRDRFVIEYETPVVGGDINAEGITIEHIGARVDSRFQVVYLHLPPIDFVPPPYIPPIPTPINTRYFYRLHSSIDYFYVENPFIASPENDTISILFTLIECTGVKYHHLGFPIYCEGLQTVPYPIPAIYNRSNNGVNSQAQLTTSKRFSLSFMYDITNKLTMVLVINGAVNVLPIPFDLDDARWQVDITANTVNILREEDVIYTADIVRGLDYQGDTVVHAKFCAHNMLSVNQNWNKNFTGITSDIGVTVNGEALFYPINDRNSALQESRPAGNDLIIHNHRKLNWIYKQY